MNIPFMNGPVPFVMGDIRQMGWAPADRATWAVIQTFWEGTQRGLLEYLFGAGAMVLTARAMRPEGPVAIADLFYRRMLWLLAFGLIDIFLIGWVGDILHIYALAALFIFPFRKLSAPVLIALGLLYATAVGIGWVGGGGVTQYHARTEMLEAAHVAQAKKDAHKALTKGEKEALEAWQKKLDVFKGPNAETKRAVAEERKAHESGPVALLRWSWKSWHAVFVKENISFLSVLEAICGMFLGMALWKLGIIQGDRSAQFYVILALLAYGFGMGARAIGVHEIFRWSPAPKTIWITSEFARLAVSLGHVALVNLLIQTAAGRAVLSPFKAAGRTAFSLYFLTSLIGIWFIAPSWGLHLWGRLGWADLALAATIVVALLLVIANIWSRYFVNGPLEWLWRSLAYCAVQPFSRNGTMGGSS